jgi:hypothetical protein
MLNLEASALKVANPALPGLGKPEKIWGAKGTDNHPKKYMERVLEQYHEKKSSGIYAELAKHSRIDVMRKQCRESFDQKLYTDMLSFL